MPRGWSAVFYNGVRDSHCWPIICWLVGTRNVGDVLFTIACYALGMILLNDIANRNEYQLELSRLGLKDVRIIIPTQWQDFVLNVVSFGSFRPATIIGQLK